FELDGTRRSSKQTNLSGPDRLLLAQHGRATLQRTRPEAAQTPRRHERSRADRRGQPLSRSAKPDSTPVRLDQERRGDPRKDQPWCRDLRGITLGSSIYKPLDKIVA